MLAGAAVSGAQVWGQRNTQGLIAWAAMCWEFLNTEVPFEAFALSGIDAPEELPMGGSAGFVSGGRVFVDGFSIRRGHS